MESPIWRHPVQSYIDENCIFFEDDEEIQHCQNDIHQGFVKLIDKILVEYIHSIGISTDQFITAIASDGKKRLSKQIVNYIMCFDDLIVFKKMMHSRNLELEEKALESFRKYELSKQKSPIQQDLQSLLKRANLEHQNLEGQTSHHSRGKPTAIKNEYAPMNDRAGNGLEAAMLELALSDSLRVVDEFNLKRGLEASASAKGTPVSNVKEVTTENTDLSQLILPSTQPVSIYITPETEPANEDP